MVGCVFSSFAAKHTPQNIKKELPANRGPRKVSSVYPWQILIKEFMKTTWKTLPLFILAALAVNLLGCASPVPADTTPVRIAVLPIVEGLPLYAAQNGGFFEKQGLKVEFIPTSSAAERDQLIAAGQADATINDLLAVALFNRDSIQLQVVRFAHVSAPGAPMYVIAAAPGSGIKNVKDLAGVEIGISQGSIIDYVTNRMLTGSGLAPDQVKTVAVPKIPDRMALLLSGQVKAATLPQPFATIAIQQGAVPVVDDTQFPGLGNSVVSFSKKFIDEHPQSVRNFVIALDQAAADVNANPEKYRSLLAKYNVVPENILAGFTIPKFPGDSLPTAQQFDDVVAFAQEHQLIAAPVKFSDSVNGSFIKP
jgi:NitT/TauT family transport system substrate-binding protein